MLGCHINWKCECGREYQGGNDREAIKGLEQSIAELEQELEKERQICWDIMGERDKYAEALEYVKRDCEARAVDGVVPLGDGCWRGVLAALQEGE